MGRIASNAGWFSSDDRRAAVSSLHGGGRRPSRTATRPHCLEPSNGASFLRSGSAATVTIASAARRSRRGCARQPKRRRHEVLQHGDRANGSPHGRHPRTADAGPARAAGSRSTPTRSSRPRPSCAAATLSSGRAGLNTCRPATSSGFSAVTRASPPTSTTTSSQGMGRRPCSSRPTLQAAPSSSANRHERSSAVPSGRPPPRSGDEQLRAGAR